MRFSRPVLLGAVCSYACTTCFVAANKLTTAANAIVLQYTNPMFVVLLSWLVLRRRAQRRDILLTAVLMGGIALFFLDELSPGHLVGNLLALCSGILMAVNTLYARYSGADVIEYGMVSCLLSVGIGAAAVITEPPGCHGGIFGSCGISGRDIHRDSHDSFCKGRSLHAAGGDIYPLDAGSSAESFAGGAAGGRGARPLGPGGGGCSAGRRCGLVLERTSEKEWQRKCITSMRIAKQQK